MKKIILFTLSVLSYSAFAQVNDFSTGNSNPVAKYNYLSPQQQVQNSQPVEYFSNNFENPKKVASKSKGKYKYLEQNAQYTNGCWDNAAKVYGLDPWLLMSIAKVESSFNHAAINLNKNKTYDLGMMQINTIWLPTLKKFGISSKDLLNPCTSIFVGAWIMAQNIKQFGYNLDGIGAYNSPRNVSIRRSYAKKVYVAYRELTNDLYYNRDRHAKN
jgi:soluble lytic murein transglycosylase-like protein